ncbi:hypothetical protein MMC21_006808 [Puttea exsequens]|nr:hypothetical protein [Puttea exsequens]
MATIPKPLRALAIVSAFLFFFLVFQMFRVTPSIQGPGDLEKEWSKEPMLEETDEPPGIKWRSDGYEPNNPNSPRINATLLALVRNEELDGMISAMQDLERTWNHKFNYPWTFFNDEEFSPDFIRLTQMETKAKCNYEVIPKEHWAVPHWINSDLFDESARILEEQDIQYGPMVSYHQMCRWNSGMFYKHPALKEIRYYWRVEPKVHFFCDVDYDIFRWMQDNNKTYGFTINLYDAPQSIPSLWPETQKFLAAHPEYEHPNNAREWVVDSARRPENNIKANGFSTCHFWSNFEIADMEFWRSKPYEDYFEHLDRAGGFFYERWGDAPVHSIALGLFEDKSKIHWFRDIGYQHIPYFNCPNSDKCKGCVKGRFTDGERFLFKEDCRPNWVKYVGMD